MVCRLIIFVYDRYDLEYFNSIEGMRAQIDFPPYSSFFSSLKGKNVSLDLFRETKNEYERRLRLPETNSEKFRNFSDYLRVYQMS